MKTPSIICALACFLLSCGSESVENVPKSTRVSKSIEEISWLTGTWQDTLRPSQWEVWTKNKFGMYGRGMAINKVDTTQFEELSLIEDNGELIYIANVKGNDLPVKFLNTELSPTKATFENPRHDFPKIITYQTYKEGDRQMLHATVGGNNKKIDLYYIKR